VHQQGARPGTSKGCATIWAIPNTPVATTTKLMPSLAAAMPKGEALRAGGYLGARETQKQDQAPPSRAPTRSRRPPFCTTSVQPIALSPALASPAPISTPIGACGLLDVASLRAGEAPRLFLGICRGAEEGRQIQRRCNQGGLAGCRRARRNCALAQIKRTRYRGLACSCTMALKRRLGPSSGKDGTVDQLAIGTRVAATIGCANDPNATAQQRSR
jgi:hypothetical protein